MALCSLANKNTIVSGHKKVYLAQTWTDMSRHKLVKPVAYSGMTLQNFAFLRRHKEAIFALQCDHFAVCL